MIDLNLKPKEQTETWQPEEIVVAILAGIIWVPLAFLIGAIL